MRGSGGNNAQPQRLERAAGTGAAISSQRRSRNERVNTAALSISSPNQEIQFNIEALPIGANGSRDLGSQVFEIR